MSDRIVVIGGGIAGLVCAIELTRAGRSVTLLESAPEVGGRVRSTVRDGFVIDHGFQVLFTAYPTLTRYLDLVALEPRRFMPAARIVSRDGVSIIGDAFRDPAVLIDSIMATSVSIVDKFRFVLLRQLAAGLSDDECYSSKYANVSTRDFLADYGFSERAINDFFAPFYGGILLDRSLSTSASALMFTFKMLASGETVVPAAGMGAITTQLAAALPADVVRVNAAVQQLVMSADATVPRVSGVMLGDGTVLAAAQVVIATDSPNALRLAATAGISLNEPQGALGCTTVYYTAARTPIPGKALWLNAARDAVISHAVTLTDVAPEYSSDGRILIAATAVGEAADLNDEALDRAARAELCAMGRVRADEVALSLVDIIRVPYSQFAQPPAWRNESPAAKTAVAGLWRASEVLHSSSLEGAARGGQMVAHALLGIA